MLGIVEDGSPADPSLPHNARRSVSVVYGETMDIRLRVVTRSGQRYAFGAGATIALTVKRAPAGEPVIAKTATIPGADSDASIAIAAADYGQIRQRGERLVYDVFLTDGSDRWAILPLAHWNIEASAAPLP